MENNWAIKVLDRIIDFIEAAIMRLSILFLMAGFITGTIAILSSQFQLSSIPAFNLTWSIVQAMALDGLFFGIWFQFRDTPWSKLRYWYGTVGILLGIVAALINTTLVYQELHNTKSVSDAMFQLGINQSEFSYIRAVLVVAVTILVCTLPRKKDETKVLDQTVTEVVEQAVSSEVSNLRVELTEIKSVLHAVFEVPALVPGGTTKELPIPERNYDRIQRYLEENPSATNRDIMDTLGIPEGTVKKHAAAIRKEMVPDRITDSIPIIS